ncbi:MAG: flagellar protein FlgN [Thermodesulfobacteriota bacterium]
MDRPFTPSPNATRPLPARLFDLLDQEEAQYRRLLEILQAEQTALLAMSMEGVIKTSKQKESQLLKIRLLDDSLQELARGLARPGQDGPVTLSGLAAAAGGDEGDRLRRHRRALLAAKDEIVQQNGLNKRFIEDTLGYLGDAIAILTTPAAPPSVYGQRGRVRTAAQTPTRISREV